MKPSSVEMEGISKSFGELRALSGVGLQIEPGQIHALIGENGAGKTTLMNILNGALPPDSGQIRIDGQVVQFSGPGEAAESGIGMVSQHYGIIPGLTCLQNLILGAEGGSLIRLSQARSRAVDLAAQMGFQIDWDQDAHGLSPGTAQKLEILKLLWRNSKILILDEPTAMLSPSDAESLFVSLKQLASQGASIILVTHRIGEVLAHCSAMTVLRKGQVVFEGSPENLSQEKIITLIAGEEVSNASGPTEKGNPGHQLIVANRCVTAPKTDEMGLNLGNFELRAGEVVGIAGVDGNGQRELVDLLVGFSNPASGEFQFLGQDWSRMKPVERVLGGLRVIPEDRLEDGLVDSWSLERNGILGLSRISPISNRGLIDQTQATAVVESIADRFHTKRGSLRQEMGELSGGNQQRFVNGRAFALNPKIIVAFQASRGLDYLATREFFEEIRRAASQGAGVLVISFDLDELLTWCDRVVVMYKGKLNSPPIGLEKDRQSIGHLMMTGAG